MILLPPHLYKQYHAYCSNSGMSDGDFNHHIKWLRYFLDYCEKYKVTGDDAERLQSFLHKLQQKGQSDTKQQQARQAVSCYFAMIRGGMDSHSSVRTAATVKLIDPQCVEHPKSVNPKKGFYNIAGYAEKTDSPEWDDVIAKLAGEIKVRHYSRKTLKTYALWSRQFQKFLKNKPPAELTTADVKEYLTYLAVKCHVAASTQNQAFNSLLFLFRHALKRDL